MKIRKKKLPEIHYETLKKKKKSPQQTCQDRTDNFVSQSNNQSGIEEAWGGSDKLQSCMAETGMSLHGVTWSRALHKAGLYEKVTKKKRRTRAGTFAVCIWETPRTRRCSDQIKWDKLIIFAHEESCCFWYKPNTLSSQLSVGGTRTFVRVEGMNDGPPHIPKLKKNKTKNNK